MAFLAIATHSLIVYTNILWEGIIVFFVFIQFCSLKSRKYTEKLMFYNIGNSMQRAKKKKGKNHKIYNRLHNWKSRIKFLLLFFFFFSIMKHVFHSCWLFIFKFTNIVNVDKSLLFAHQLNLGITFYSNKESISFLLFFYLLIN